MRQKNNNKDEQQVRVIRDRDGNVLTSSTSVMERYKENFEELMNKENNKKQIVEESAVVQQEVAKIGKNDMRKTLKMKKCKKR